MSNQYPDKIEPKTIPPQLVKLMEAIHTTLSDQDRARLAPLLDNVVEDTCRRRRILALIQETLGQLRLDLKYLAFDLEATRRERDALERKLNP